MTVIKNISTPPPEPSEKAPGEAAKGAEKVGKKEAVKGGAKVERSALALDQAADSAAEKREELKDEVYDFTDEEKVKYKKAFNKDLEPKALASLTLDELNAAEAKEPGITKVLFKKRQKDQKEMFTAHNNHDVEWKKGLRDLVEGNVSQVTLYIHPKNLTKAANRDILARDQKAKDAMAAYKETPSKIIFFERKGTKRDDGNFYNEDGYLRIFDGDTWSIDKTRTDAQREEPTAKTQAKTEVPTAPQKRETHPEHPEPPLQAKKPESIDGALEAYGNTFLEESEKQGVPLHLIQFMYALSHAESKWSMRSDNPHSTAHGIGQLLDSTARGIHRGLVKSGRTDIPQDSGEFLRQMKTDARLQIMAFVRIVKSEAQSIGSKLPDHNPMKNLDEIGMTFMAIAHHDGLGGVNGYIRWWKAKGSPNTIPKFPDKETALQYLHVANQKKRGMNGNEGTNGLIDWANNIARAANSYETKVANFIGGKRALAKSRTSNTESSS